MKRKYFAMLLTLLFAVATIIPTQTFAATGTTKPINENLGVPIVVYGANLSEAEREAVKTALRVDEEPEVDEITVAGADLALSLIHI